MKANELRIGNYVNVPNKQQSPFRVDYFDESKVYQKNGTYQLPGFETDIPFHPLTWDLSDCSGIVLIPELLEKCGFEKINHRLDGVVYKREWLRVSERISSWEWRGGYIKDGPKYLHQLQNLYFALTGEELQVNL